MNAMILFATMLSVLIGTAAENHAYPISPDKGGRENTEWFQFYSFHVRDKDLPRVLLIGDSITQSIRGKVEKALAGQANVTYWISSYPA